MVKDKLNFFDFSGRQILHPNCNRGLAFPLEKPQTQLDFTGFTKPKPVFLLFGIEMLFFFVRIANLAESEHSCFMSVFSGIKVFFEDCLNGLTVDWVLTFGRKVQRSPVDPVAGLLKMLFG